MTPRARILRGAATAAPEGEGALFALRPTAAQWRRIAREELEARLAAEHILQEATSKAREIEVRSRVEAKSAVDQAMHDAREKAEAEVAAKWLTTRSEEGARLEREMDRIVSVAVVLAERLLGAALELHPERVVDLARAAIAEARGARRVSIEAHPMDAGALKGRLSGAGVDLQSVDVLANEALARGDLRLQTDVGIIDAKLATRLERLAAALRDALP